MRDFSFISYRVIGNHERRFFPSTISTSFSTFLYHPKKQFIMRMLCVNYYAAISPKIRRMKIKQHGALSMYVNAIKCIEI